MRSAAYLLLPVLLSGCASTSFAPPQVDVHNPMTGASLDRQCNVAFGGGDTIGKDVNGAQALISNYLDSYRCVMRVSANGRQPWEVLSFLSLVAATTAGALGAGRNVAVLGSSANSVFTAGNGYYAPRVQAGILNDAVDALACIQAESVGIDPFEVKAAAQAESNSFSFDGGNRGSTIEVTAERQYFNMVYSALITTERATATRLEGRGFDAAGIQAQVDALTQKLKDAEAAKEGADAGGSNGGDKKGNGGAGGNSQSFYAQVASTDLAARMKALETVQLDLAILKPKLEKCALRAQGGGSG